MREYPSRLRSPEYGSEANVRRVRTNGQIKWKGSLIYLSEALVGEPFCTRRTGSSLDPWSSACWMFTVIRCYTYKSVTYVPGLDVTHLPGCTVGAHLICRAPLILTFSHQGRRDF